MFRWDDVRIFLAVMRERSFTKAGKTLGMNQSTVSRRVALLESELGVHLFDRTPEGLIATTAAQQIVQTSESMEQAVHELSRLVEGRDASYEGIVRISAFDGTAAHILAPAMPKFFERYPNIQLEIIPSEDVVDLARREADLAIRMFRPTEGELVVKSIIHSPYSVYASPRYLFRFQKTPELQELDWLTWSRELSHVPEARWYSEVIKKEPIMRSSHMGTLLNAAIAGTGAILFTKKLAAWVPHLQEVPSQAPMPPDLQMWLVGHRTIRQIPRVKAVWSFIEDLFYEIEHFGPNSSWFPKGLGII